MSSFANILQSGSIRLLTGDREFIVHRDLLEHNLPNLHISSRDRYVDFDGDEESVGYLLEYLYTGDYTPTPTPTPTNQAQAQDQPPHYDEGEPKYNEDRPQWTAAEEEPHPMVLAARTSGLGIWGRPAAIHTKFNHEVPLSTQQQPFQSPPPPQITSDYPHPASVTAATTSPTTVVQPSEPSVPANNNIASTFLTHARIYLLAQRYAFSSLQDFSLQKLRAALKTAELEPAAGGHTASSVALIRDIYELQPRQTERTETETVQKLRDVVVAHAVSQLQELQGDEGFGAFVKEGGDFVGDLLGALTSSRLMLR